MSTQVFRNALRRPGLTLAPRNTDFSAAAFGCAVTRRIEDLSWRSQLPPVATSCHQPPAIVAAAPRRPKTCVSVQHHNSCI
ncbi:hypothetical protein GN956_G14260 [Arapaima gigas]